MRRRNRNQSQTEQRVLREEPQTEYSVEQILSEFWEEYTDDVTEAEDQVISAESEAGPDPEYDEYPDAGDDPAAEVYPEERDDRADGQPDLWDDSFLELNLEEPEPEREPEPVPEPAKPEPAEESGDWTDFDVMAFLAEEAAFAEKAREEAASAPPPVKREEKNRAGKNQIVEEFPEDPAEESEAFTDNIDYAALFKMFAEPSAEESAGAAWAAEDEYTAESVDLPEELFAAEEKPEPAEEKKSGRRQPSGGEEKKREEAPLFAEEAPDFRDILREFMMGDQHPIYADMPGIGQKADELKIPQEEFFDAGGRKTERREEAEKEPARKNYEVREDFPLDFVTDFPPEEDNPKPEKDTGETVTDSRDGSLPETGSSVPEERQSPASRLRARLQDIGNNLRSSGSRKKALNEPKAYLGYEDFLPSGEEEEKKPAEAETAKAEPDAPQVPDAADKTAEGTHARTESEGTAEDAARPAEELPEEEELLYEGDFPSFGQWILNELMNFWIKINGIGDRRSTATMEDKPEDLGAEVNVANASRYYGSQVTMLRMRFEIGLVLLAVLAWLTLGFPVSGMLKTVKVLSAMCLGLQLTVMLLCLDVVTNAAINLTRGKFGADTLAVLACLISSFDALILAVAGFGTPHVPLCFFSSLALMGVLLSSLLTSRALRKSIRVPAIGKRAYSVTAEEGVRGKDITLLKSMRPLSGFVRRSEESPPDESLFSRSALIQLLAAMVLSLAVGIVKHGMRDYLYILSAILSCAVPVTALLSFALPYFIGSQRIFSSGAAVAGWSGMHDIGSSRNLIVTDRDLFPEETIAIETVRVFADESAERVIGYAGTMVAASGSGLGPAFAELMEKNGSHMRRVEDFQWLSGGGLQGRIEGHTVLCGNSDVMQLMNVKIPYRLVDSTTVLLAIDGTLYGIFKIAYTGLPEIRSALQELIASNRHPIFAIRDFNITPNMLHEVFDVATDGYDFPPYGDRFRISEAQPSETSKISAVVCREGLGPLTHLADTGRSMYVAVRLNLLITAAVAVLGMLLVFFRLIGTGVLNTWLPFALMVLDALAVTAVSVFMRF